MLTQYKTDFQRELKNKFPAADNAPAPANQFLSFRQM